MDDWTDLDEALYSADARERDRLLEAAEREYARHHPVLMREPQGEDDVF